MNTPTISVPVDTLLNLAALSKSDGVNAKGQMAEIIKGILDEHLKEMEMEVCTKE